MFTTDQFTWNADSKTFSRYISELREFCVSTHVANRKPVRITNPLTKKFQEFSFTHADMDGSQEDTYGWNFRSKEGINLLIIND